LGSFAFCVSIVFHCSHRKNSVGWIPGTLHYSPFFQRVANYCLNTETCCFQFGKSNFFVHSTRYTIIQELTEVFKSRTVRLDFISRHKTCRASDAPLGMIFPQGGIHPKPLKWYVCLAAFMNNFWQFLNEFYNP
jgi:hypothetical protein